MSFLELMIGLSVLMNHRYQSVQCGGLVVVFFLKKKLFLHINFDYGFSYSYKV